MVSHTMAMVSCEHNTKQQWNYFFTLHNKKSIKIVQNWIYYYYSVFIFAVLRWFELSFSTEYRQKMNSIFAIVLCTIHFKETAALHILFLHNFIVFLKYG